jgi:hypothetical protein
MNDVPPASASSGFVYEAFDLQGKVHDDKLCLQPGYYQVDLTGQATGVDFGTGDGITGCTAGIDILNAAGEHFQYVPVDETRHYSYVTRVSGVDQSPFALCFSMLIEEDMAYEDGYARLKPYIQAQTATENGHLDITYDLMIRPL